MDDMKTNPEADIQFLRQKEHLLANRAAASQKLHDARQSYMEMFRGNDPRKEIKLQYEMNKVRLCENSLELVEDKLKFMRPSREEDIAYRNRQYNEFANKISALVPEDLPLRFHGCPIYAAEKIIQSGEISSSADRLGVGTSYDGAGQISVTSKDNLHITTQGYTDLIGDYSLPAGCVFVLTPNDLADEETGEHQMMDSVSFKSDPSRLVAVISTPENTETIRGWLQNNDLDVQKATDFDGFVGAIDKFIDSVEIPYRNISHGKVLGGQSGLDSFIARAQAQADVQRAAQPTTGKGSLADHFAKGER